MASDQSRDEVIDSILQDIPDKYQRARDIHLENENTTGERDWLGMVNFRDSLHHLCSALQAIERTDLEEANQEYVKTIDHLDRVMYDGSKMIADYEISKIEDERLSPPILYKIGLYFNVPDKQEFNDRMGRIRGLYEQGRDKHSPKYFEEAERLSSNLNDDHPPRGNVIFRIIGVLGFVISLLVGLYTVVGPT
jgi:hypothetical protein